MRRHFLIRPIILVGVLSLLACLSGCPSTPLGASNHAMSSQSRVTIRYSIWGSFEEWEMWRDIVRAFERRNPSIKVKIEYWPAAYEDKVKVLMASDRAPDVMEMQDEPFQMYCTKEKFEDLGPYMKSAGKELAPDKFLPTSLEVFRFNRDNKQMGLPWDGGGIIVFYNKHCFRKAGVPFPRADWTWNDFVQICKKLTKDFDGDGRTDQFGCELTSWWPYMQIFIWAHGGKFFDAEDTRIGGMTRAAPLSCMLDDPHVVRALQFCQDLRYKHHVAPHPAESAGRDQDVLFMTGRIAMRFNGPWGMPFLRQAKGLDWDVAPIPIGPTGRRETRSTWDGVTIARTSKHKLEAWKLVKFIVGEPGQRSIARSRRGVPALASVANSADFVDPKTPQHEEYFVDAVKYGRIQPITEIWTEMDPIMQRENDKLLLGKQDAATTARIMARDVNHLLRQRGLWR